MYALKQPPPPSPPPKKNTNKQKHAILYIIISPLKISKKMVAVNTHLPPQNITNFYSRLQVLEQRGSGTELH